MSEPVTNVDVEDVLASIRRLVSEDRRPAAHETAPVAPEPKAARAEPEKLVLTPSLRVTDRMQPATEDSDILAQKDWDKDTLHAAAETAAPFVASVDPVLAEEDNASQQDDVPEAGFIEVVEDEVEAEVVHLSWNEPMHGGAVAEALEEVHPVSNELPEGWPLEEPANSQETEDADSEWSEDADDAMFAREEAAEDHLADPEEGITVEDVHEVTSEPETDQSDEIDNEALSDDPAIARFIAAAREDEAKPVVAQDPSDDEEDEIVNLVSNHVAANEQEAPAEVTVNSAETSETEDENWTKAFEFRHHYGSVPNVAGGYKAEQKQALSVAANTEPRMYAVADPNASLSDKVAALEEVIGQRKDQWEPDGVAQDAYSGTQDPAITWDENNSEAEQDGEEPEPLILASEDTERETSAELLEAVEQEVEPTSMDEAPEEPISAADEPEPNAQVEIAQEEPTTAKRQEPLILSEAAVVEEPDEDLLAREEAYLDETMLRDLVAEIVREELQGTLGERITRNVRKLVRREIHRAMNTQDLQ